MFIVQRHDNLELQQRKAVSKFRDKSLMILFLFSNYVEMCQRVKTSHECKWIKNVIFVDKGKDYGNS